MSIQWVNLAEYLVAKEKAEKKRTKRRRVVRPKYVNVREERTRKARRCTAGTKANNDGGPENKR